MLWDAGRLNRGSIRILLQQQLLNGSTYVLPFRYSIALSKVWNTVWQDGFHPIAIETVKFFQQKLNYLQENPVRKGFVEKPEHRMYSSARNYILDDHSLIQIEIYI